MSEEKKREKTRREDYCQLGAKSKPKKSLVFGMKSKVRKKKEKESDERSPSPVLQPFSGDRGVFGVPLSVAVLRTRSHDGVPLPVIVRQCIDYINEKGLRVEGIYRISAPKSRLDELEAVANSRRAVQLTDVHDASGLLKRFLRQLPQHVLTEEMRNNFEEIAAKCPCRALPACRCLVADMLKARLSRLPTENYYLLAYVLLHAQQIVANREWNKMGIAALGLLLQATLNISQNLLRIFLLNAGGLISQDDNNQVVYLFKDVQIKKYIEPREPKSICEENLPDNECELIEEEAKQRSRHEQLHQQIAELLEMKLDVRAMEEEVWDVQTAITLLNRKLKTVRGRRSESVSTSESEWPTLEMFEEKQLLAACTALREDITRGKLEIIALEKRLTILLSESCESVASMSGQEGEPGEEEDFWRDACTKEEARRAELLEQIIEQRRCCCLLRAKLEMNAVKQPALLVTRF